MKPGDYGYRGDEQITITGREFLLLRKAIEDAINNATLYRMDEIWRWVDENGEYVENPSSEDVLQGKVRRVTDIKNTVSESNLTVYFDPKMLTNEMLFGQELLLDIHLRNINNNIATNFADAKSN
jgi:hypothetical protein